MESKKCVKGVEGTLNRIGKGEKSGMEGWGRKEMGYK